MTRYGRYIPIQAIQPQVVWSFAPTGFRKLPSEIEWRWIGWWNRREKINNEAHMLLTALKWVINVKRLYATSLNSSSTSTLTTVYWISRMLNFRVQKYTFRLFSVCFSHSWTNKSLRPCWEHNILKCISFLCCLSQLQARAGENVAQRDTELFGTGCALFFWCLTMHCLLCNYNVIIMWLSMRGASIRLVQRL